MGKVGCVKCCISHTCSGAKQPGTRAASGFGGYNVHYTDDNCEDGRTAITSVTVSVARRNDGTDDRVTSMHFNCTTDFDDISGYRYAILNTRMHHLSV